MVGVSEPEIAGGTPREDPADGTPRKKARSGEAAVDRTEAAGVIKGVRERPKPSMTSTSMRARALGVVVRPLPCP